MTANSSQAPNDGSLHGHPAGAMGLMRNASFLGLHSYQHLTDIESGTEHGK